MNRKTTQIATILSLVGVTIFFCSVYSILFANSFTMAEEQYACATQEIVNAIECCHK